MTAAGYIQGHYVEYDEEEQCWKYEDGECCDPDAPRPCVACGENPTTEGYDHCLGFVKGVKAACCGHGVAAGYLLFVNGRYREIPPIYER